MSQTVGVVVACAAATTLLSAWYLISRPRRSAAGAPGTTVDPATGLHDPRVLDRVIADAVTAGRPLSVIVVDLGPLPLLAGPHHRLVLSEVGRRVGGVDGVSHVLRTGDAQVTAVVPVDGHRAMAAGVAIARRVAAPPVGLPDGRLARVWVRCGIATHRAGESPAELLGRACAAAVRRPRADGWWRCWFDATDLVPLADHAAITPHHRRGGFEAAAGVRCPGGIAIASHGGLVTAVSTGWPPLLGDPHDAGQVRTAYPVHTDPPPLPGLGTHQVAHIHLDAAALDAVHRAADWGGVLAVTVHGPHATFTLTRPTTGGGRHG